MVLVDYEVKEEVKAQEKPGQAGAPGGEKPGAGRRIAAGKKEEKKEEKEDEEKKKKEEEEKKQEEKKEDGELSDWDFLYGALDLFTNNRKRNQIILLHNVVFRIKEEFNKEFDKTMVQRQQQLDNLNDKNKRIDEILTELKKQQEVFEAKKNVLENPEEKILNVDPDKEIPFQKFLTREERERRERERLKEEERLRQLMSDDAGQRAVKQMMGGTLEEKKETPLDEQLIVEEWMSKPVEEMNEEERIRFKEFEVKK